LCFDKRNSLTIEDKIIIIKRSKRLRLRTRWWFKVGFARF
jgi:hypothetical protein